MNNMNVPFITSGDLLDTLYGMWLSSPRSVDQEWQDLFSTFQKSNFDSNWTPNVIDYDKLCQERCNDTIISYRSLGHFGACTDPLSPCQLFHPQLSVNAYQREYCHSDGNVIVESEYNQAKLRDLIAMLEETYCREIGVEFMHIQDEVERQWLINRMEPCRNHSDYDHQIKLYLLQQLFRANLFETFLQRHFPGQKRFSLEGSEVLIPVLDYLAGLCSTHGIISMILGMAHRGRLNILAHLLEKPYENIFAEFHDTLSFGFIGDGDVKYHKGYSVDRSFNDGNVHITLVANPSHLEAVNSVAEGKCKARQLNCGLDGDRKVLPVLVHGDAAFSGQGSVMETLNLSKLDGYSTGGTIHVVLNNQIGFTTSARDARSTRYATDVAKMLECPIFHVQGEAPEAALHVVRLALEYRQAFGRDVVIELVCYRRHGHNEGDEPAFTQPLMYQQIQTRPPVSRIYADTLAREGVSQALLDSVEREVVDTLNAALNKTPQQTPVGFKNDWSSMECEYVPDQIDTKVNRDKLLVLAKRLAELPPGFVPHDKIHSLVQRRFEVILKNNVVDWGNAESLAYATLLDEGHSVRLSGQDSRRGTFSHRHCVLHDFQNGRTYTPLDAVCQNGAQFQAWDSPLSEFGVLGFEYGYSLETPAALTIWEAQFGDFANGAQVIIDQFIASGETKWNRASGLVLFLPHGYEGQGAEHSSARIERFLQLCANNNMIVANPTTPAQLFHLLRRQLKQSFRKPLVVFTPKSLLRHPDCVSSVLDLSDGMFSEIILDNDIEINVRRLLVCSGKIYYELLQEKKRRECVDISLMRVEQLYPLRNDLIQYRLKRLPQDIQVVWVQEEPENMGGWHYIQPLMQECCGNIQFIGRPADSCPAVGSHHLHSEQQKNIINKAFEF